MDMPGRPQLLDRRLTQVALERLREDPVVLVEGPRTVGKSTLLRALASAVGADVLDLDQLATRDAVAVDPSAFVAGQRPVFVDEYQKAPAVLDAIKAELNTDTRPGRFALTGSTRHDSLPPAAQALTGRLARLRLYPLSQGEIHGVHERFVDDLFTDPDETVARIPTSSTGREEYVRRLVTGGFPLAIARGSDAARNRWFDSYVSLTLERDVRELSRIRQGSQLPLLLARLAGQTAQLLNVHDAARDIAVDRVTAENYTRLLEAVFLIHRLPAWGKTLTARAVGTPKVHVLDSGVAARLLKLTGTRLQRKDPTALKELGHLLESFVVAELLKQTSWLEEITVAGHWRTRDGDEVDVILEHEDGSLVGIEVKAAARVPGDDFRALRKLRTAAGDLFRAGIVLHLGQRSYTYEDRLHAMPIDRLWT
jgi:predicted AAA+ superfamily ATPase